MANIAQKFVNALSGCRFRISYRHPQRQPENQFTRIGKVQTHFCQCRQFSLNLLRFYFCNHTMNEPEQTNGNHRRPCTPQ
nr:hypothetical protein [uncultured Kingella sp.]